ncbi:hypothetical protein SAMN05428957_10340 [Oryzisolibacter propanilivorax]|uniref:Toxin CptA n=1 Tax=Oryzisolibacter propanilivorax TaxID=1527607 RepID=A0A1G9R6L5_9BURK|nr:hypothetical protein [Oryzisolibacter propanilivorax]SDM18477.1 hypothetical protein SAMN05428957_10340 [Oryzisolibacter propanilivorax]
MRAHLLPPSARHAFGRTAGLGLALLVLAGSGLAAVIWWLVLGAGQMHRTAWVAAGLSGWTACALLAWRWWRELPAGLLAWDGAAWSLEPATAGTPPQPLTQPPRVALDLQSALLLSVRLQPCGTRWLWLRQGAATSPDAWLSLRRALYSRAFMAPDPGPSPTPPST